MLVIALIYEWRSGALDWGIKTRTGLKQAAGYELTPAAQATTAVNTEGSR